MMKRNQLRSSSTPIMKRCNCANDQNTSSNNERKVEVREVQPAQRVNPSVNLNRSVKSRFLKK